MEVYVQNKLQRRLQRDLTAYLNVCKWWSNYFFSKQTWFIPQGSSLDIKNNILYQVGITGKKNLLEIPGKVFAKGQVEKIRKFVHFLI